LVVFGFDMSGLESEDLFMKSLKIFVILIILLLVLSACQLAREGIGQEEAWMVGVFITTEHLDLWDRSFEGQTIPMRRRQPDFSALFQPGRLYAQWDEEIRDFRFPDMEGIALFAAMSPPHVPNETVISHVGPEISGGHTHAFFGDNYRHVEMEGTIHVVPGARTMTTIFMNPVFQTACGRVFLTSGSGFSNEGITSQGRIFSTNLAETRTVTENRTEYTHSTSVTLSIYGMFAPTKIVLLQMDEYSRVVMRTEFAPAEMPHEFNMEADTAYVIVETHRDDQHAQTHVVRELTERGFHDRQWISTFVARDDGILMGSGMEIIWPGRDSR